MINKQTLIPIYNKVFGHNKKIKGNNNIIKEGKSIFKKTVTRISGNDNIIEIGKNSRLINSSIIIKGDHHRVIIGDDIILKNTVVWIEDNNNKVIIGNKTTIEEVHIASTEPHSSIKIGQDCMLSSGIDIRNGDSHSIINLENKKRINYAEDIEIGNHVWIGYNAQILKGVNIGSDSVIGTRSVVTKDVPANSIVSGVPAKVVKLGITWDRKRIYDKSQ